LGAGRIENVGQFGAEFPDRLLVCLHDTYGNACTLVYDGVHVRVDAQPTRNEPKMINLRSGDTSWRNRSDSREG
jgi:hypothetical protein